jgi:hypothetical protein
LVSDCANYGGVEMNGSVAGYQDGLDLDFGTGAEGDLDVPAGQTVKTDGVKSPAVGNNPAGMTQIEVQDATGFNMGDEVLIISMRDPEPDLNLNVTGQFETHRAASVMGSTLVLEAPLEQTYDAGGNRKHQVIRVPNYQTVTVNGTLTSDDWNGSVGGVVFFRATGAVSVSRDGQIIAGAFSSDTPVDNSDPALGKIVPAGIQSFDGAFPPRSWSGDWQQDCTRGRTGRCSAHSRPIGDSQQIRPRVQLAEVGLLGVGLATGGQFVVVLPASLDFGTVTVGQSKMLQLNVFNVGTLNLEVDEVTVSGMGFSSTPLEGRMEPGQRRTVTVTFMPPAAGMFSGRLTIASNDPGGDVDVPLSGTGTQ